ncbi:MAG: biofilm regulation protein phosphatase SiaA [Giesbergeria sp.]|uniref:biofilm regulation protein phosphatase SiaA n=1 Tax=Giesbergeria sp. TaxID=2818473 RepID=UPI0026360F13|nr:biofilm regulation protein phosphatase SiaA [Giesbergeria sp.]MDD2608669.1 biofilm regulation protein phosphatase SiaA [Giesbergeria sp.]
MTNAVPSWMAGLRAKSMLALTLACALALLPAVLIGWQVLDGVRNYFGQNYARNYTQLKRESILALVARELALSLRLADSVVTRQWLLDEGNAAKKALFFEEAEGYRQDFRDHAYFLASTGTRHFYFNDNTKPFSAAARYTLDWGQKKDAWFAGTLNQSGSHYNINVDNNVDLQITKVWFNVIIRSGERKLGVTGTGLDLTGFLKDFITTSDLGVTPMILTAAGAIHAHPNRQLIAINTAGLQPTLAHTLAGQLPAGAQRDALAAAMAQAVAKPGEVSSFQATLDGKEQLLALSYIPELQWHIVTAVDLKAAQVLNQGWLQALVAAVVALLCVLLLGFGYAVEKLVLQPLRKLQKSASALAQGDFSVSLPPDGRDELGDLTRAFATMVRQIRSNTEELEHKVQERTLALEEANRDMRRAHQQINDSIDYASLIQQATLPSQQLTQLLGPHQFVLWRPRDVVGGDFYVFRAEGQRYLLGVVDCAGHGVPGALMTMLARSALDHAMAQVGIASPAAILGHTDTTMRAMLQHSELPRAVATNMDVGLAYVDREARTLHYAGAKISLYWSDGQTVQQVKGGRRALGDRRQGSYTDTPVEMVPGATYYLTTDGFLDQAGGELGYGFGDTRFAQVLLAHARLPMEQQASALNQVLEAYRGDYPQRDDITLLSFRIT